MIIIIREDIKTKKEFSDLLLVFGSIAAEASIIAVLSSEEIQTISSPFE
jgi:hypothetical protein